MSFVKQQAHSYNCATLFESTRINDSKLSWLQLRMYANRTKALAIALALLVGLLILSGTRPYNRGTWLMEVAPILMALPILWITYKPFPLTTLLYICIFAHAL